jgi:hypothetical protein
MKLRICAALRARAAFAALIGIGLVAAPIAAPATAAASTIRFNTSNQVIPLLLIHGFNDSCWEAWDSVGYQQDKKTPLPQPNSTARGFLAGQFTNIKRVGYYAVDGSCDENLNTDSTLTQCNGFAESAADYGAKLKDRLDRLSCLFAWYIYNNYTQYGEPVNVLAHSMGGLLTRYALGAAGTAPFPPVLWVNNVVTVATPHGGVSGLYHNAAGASGLAGVELDMMDPGNPNYSFMRTIAGYQRPQGFDGTRWTLIGASDASIPGGDGGGEVSSWASQDGDGVVATDSQMSMTADYKVEYGAHSPWVIPGNIADLNTMYEHETLMGCFFWIFICFNGPYYLNDSSTASTKAWTCSFCAGRPSGSPIPISRSLATIAAQLQQKPVPNLSSYDLVWRSSANGNYVSAELGYVGVNNAMLRARAAAKGATESWTRVQLPTGHWVIRSNANGLYVAAELNYAGVDYGELRARTDPSVISSSEVFDFSPNADGSYSVRSLANGLYVSAEFGYGGTSYGELRARAASVGPWEEFTASTAGPANCVNYGGSTITGPDSCAGTFSRHSIWYSGGGLGLQGREIWTWANGSVQDSTATYQLSGLSTRYLVEVDAFIPRYHSNARHVHYRLCAPGNGCTNDYVDQSPLYDQWTAVGYLCTNDGTATITLADDGGDVYPKQIAADAIRGVSTRIIC